MNKKNLNPYQLENLQKAEALQAELIQNGFMATRIEKDEDQLSVFDVIFFDGENDYKIHRDYNGYVRVSLSKHVSYPHLSSHARAEVYKAYDSGNIKVITAKKLQSKIDDEKAIHAKLTELEKEAIEKHSAFLASIKETADTFGLSITWSRGYNEEIKGGSIRGSITHNGINFDFDLCDDGYISKKITVSYTVESNIENFVKLCQNKFK